MIIKGAPTSGLCYSPSDPKYWNEAGLKAEIERIFDICNGCRLCFNLCPSFPDLFKTIDGYDGDVRKLTPADVDRVIDLCFQCKICYVKCPYTPEDKHEFQLDFPRLIMRANAIRRKKRSGSLRSYVLSRPELLGRLAGMAPALANWANRQPLLRAGLEKVLGIHREKVLPEFHGETFEEWHRKQPRPESDSTKAVLFYTCSVNYNAPEVGRDAIEVFAKNGIALTCPKQNCCGMPALESGDVELAKRWAQQNVESLLPHVRAGK
ncbi:MAG TPA: heterodisulfide reductase-related iron-sulfur binding cluster, partial [Bryobacteraceae bacterium]|nr:heterodisulfide reductase-related iron-sulfur binding cluster [Bryobacteraceae bacterium]